MRLLAFGISKKFGATQALHDVQLSLAEGEIHALLGENGAGKSTLVKILSGAEPPDRGLILLDSQPYAPRGPIEARALGVSVVTQETTLAGDLSVEENLLLGAEPAFRGWIKRSRRRTLARAALAELHSADLPLQAPVRILSPADRQRVEIARAFLARPKLLILDEPTRSLSHWESASLFDALRQLAARGVSILYISHFLEEFPALCTRYTVLRDGARVASGAVSGVDRSLLVELMTGQRFREAPPRSRRHLGKPLLRLQRVSGRPMPCRINLTLHEGEILGLAGLDGAGRSETLRTVFGLSALREGQIWQGRRRWHWGSPARRLRAGIGFAGAERREGVLPDLSVADNLTLPALRRFSTLGVIAKERQAFVALDWMEKLRIRARTPHQESSELSSGNQQKLVLGRLLLQPAVVFLLDEPTRGLDVPTKAQVHLLLEALAAEGKGILLTSSDPAELLGVCDTIALMREGRLVKTRPAGEWTEPEIIAGVMGPP